MQINAITTPIFVRSNSVVNMNAFTYIPHPRIENRKVEKPPKVNDERLGFNGLLGSKITIGVGTMWAAYAFCALAFVSLPQVISTHNATTIVSWIAQTFLQLVLLPIIIVGQNIQGKASDKRAIQTYDDAEAILHECQQLQAHLSHQDDKIGGLIDKINDRLEGLK